MYLSILTLSLSKTIRLAIVVVVLNGCINSSVRVVKVFCCASLT